MNCCTEWTGLATTKYSYKLKNHIGVDQVRTCILCVEFLIQNPLLYDLGYLGEALLITYSSFKSSEYIILANYIHNCEFTICDKNSVDMNIYIT